MKLVFASASSGPHDARFIAAASEAGHDVRHLLIGGGAATGPGWVVDPDQPLSERVAAVRSHLAAFAPALVHAGPIQDVAFVVRLATEVPLLAMSWGSDLMRAAQSSRASADLASFVLGRAQGFIGDCVSVDRAARTLGWEGQSTLFPWGIDVDAFEPQGDKRDFGGGSVVLSTRNWEPIYDVPTLARAFVDLDDTGAHLVLGGSGSAAAELEGLLQPAIDRGAATLLGRTQHSELPAVYRGADIYVSTSLSDGSSVSLLEAMGSGLPVVVSDIPSNREWVSPEENGVLFETGSSDSLRAALAHVLSLSPTQRAEMGSRGRALVERRADWRAGRAALLRAYESLGAQ